VNIRCVLCAGKNKEHSVGARYAVGNRIIRNDCRGFNNLSYTINLRQQYEVVPMDQEILKDFLL
jgi:hypothetical protein